MASLVVNMISSSTLLLILIMSKNTIRTKRQPVVWKIIVWVKHMQCVGSVKLIYVLHQKKKNVYLTIIIRYELVIYYFTISDS